jgi:hypothetical protein
MFAFKTLGRRLIVLLVLPVTMFLLIIGVFGYRFIQGLLFKDWQEIAILRPGTGRPPVGHAPPWADAMDGDLCSSQARPREKKSLALGR